MDKTYIFGHRRPDTDSVTASIALSYLKNEQGYDTIPAILDDINKETEYVLDYFNFKQPDFLNDVKLRIENLNYYKGCFLNQNESIKRAYDYMKEQKITGVPLVDNKNRFVGLVTVKMLANELINGDYTKVKTSYNNILNTINGEVGIKAHDEICGNIVVAAYKSSTILTTLDLNKDSILIVGDRPSIIKYAIQKGVKLMIIVGGYTLKEEMLYLAKSSGVSVIYTTNDTFHTVKFLSLSGYVKNILSDRSVEKILETEYYDDFIDLSKKQGYNNYPIINEDDVCLGLLRVTDLKENNKKSVILVDHNESSQSVIGLDEAEILEIVDHHKIGDLTTNQPINFRNMAVGSTNTIIYMLYKEASVKIPKDIAGIMAAGIISDTLNLTSPTTTKLDKQALKYLSTIAGIVPQDFAKEMFKAGSAFGEKSTEEIINTDIKIFPIDDDVKFAISQVLTLNHEELLQEKEQYIEALDKMCKEEKYKLALFVITDIQTKGSYILYSSSSENIVKEAYNLDNINQGIYFKDVLSRKKQIVPSLMKYLQGGI